MMRAGDPIDLLVFALDSGCDRSNVGAFGVMGEFPF
jgi:hypothetical protein